MTREEEDRRLALATAIAKLNAAIDLAGSEAVEAVGCRGLVDRAIGSMRSIRDVAEADLDAMKRKAIDETPKEDR